MEENTKSENVKWKTLKEICKISTGKLNANAKVENGEYPFFTCQKVPNKIDKYSFDTEAVLMAGNGNVGNVHYYSGKFDAYQRTYIIETLEVNVKFLYYYLKTFFKGYIENYKKEGIISYITLPVLEKFLVTLPPLKKQEEIAAVLDKFTELTEELTARETQYDYYRNMLLIDQWNDKNIKFENAEIIRTTVGDIIERCSEKAKNDKNVATVYTVSSEFGLIPSIDYWKRKGSKNKKSYKMFSDDTSNYNIVRKNMFAYNPARLNIGSISCLLNEKTGLLSPMYNVFKIKENIILPKYLLYFLKTPTVINKIDLMKESGARNRFDFEKWKKIEISIPAIGVQQKILNILDSFETLVNDIRQGLPKEIELRQKQYEYYREKLLTFEEE